MLWNSLARVHTSVGMVVAEATAPESMLVGQAELMRQRRVKLGKLACGMGSCEACARGSAPSHAAIFRLRPRGLWEGAAPVFIYRSGCFSCGLKEYTGVLSC